MRIRRIDKAGDWMHGQGLANYADRDEAIIQNAVTKLKEFHNDWIWDVTTGADWLSILGRKGNAETIKREVERILLGSDGIKSVDNVEIKTDGRTAQIGVQLTTLYNKQFTRYLGL